MEIEKNSLKSMILINFIIGVLVVIVKLYNPMYSNVQGILSAIANREIGAMFFILMLIIFVMYSYILFLIGLYIIGARTIGRIIRFIKEILVRDSGYSQGYNDEYNYTDVGVIAVYILLMIPLMLYILWPALSGILLIMLVIYVFGSSK